MSGHIKDRVAYIMKMRTEVMAQLGIDAERVRALEDDSTRAAIDLSVATYVQCVILEDANDEKRNKE